MRKYFIVGALFIISVLLSNCANQQPPSSSMQSLASQPEFAKPRIEVAFSLVTSTPTLGEPITVMLTVENESDELIFLQLGMNRRRGVSLEMKKRDSSVSVKGHAQPDAEYGTSGEVRLKPKSILQHRILINEWFDGLDRGDYILSINLTDRIILQPSGKTFLPEATELAISIKDKDRQKLTSLSEELLQASLTSTSLEDQIYATRSLICVRDPIVIPFVEKAVRADPEASNRIIQALVNQNSENAVDILIGLLSRVPDRKDLSSIVEFALENMDRQLNNTRVKEKIRSALPHYHPLEVK